MPGQNYAEIASQLMSAGLAGDVACAVISRATTKQQQTHRTTVLDLHRAPRLASPTLLVVGEVVRLSDPAAAEEWAMPSVPAANDNLLPATLFKTFPPRTTLH
jgi:uroporphyrin-III C-methyltransferase